MATSLLDELKDYLGARVVTRARHMVLGGYKAKAKLGWDQEKVVAGIPTETLIWVAGSKP
eukprot:4543488-Pyramimonas_sp.AAC.1